MTVVTKTQINDAGGELIPEGTELKVISAGYDIFKNIDMSVSLKEVVKVEFNLRGIQYRANIGLKVFQLFCEEDLQ